MSAPAQRRPRWRGVAWHPFLFCVWPLLEVYSQNVAEVELASFATWASGTLAAVALAIGLLWPVYRDWQKSAVIATWLLLIFFLYPTASRAVALGAGPWLPAAVVTGTVGLALFVYRSRSSFGPITGALNVMSVVVLG